MLSKQRPYPIREQPTVGYTGSYACGVQVRPHAVQEGGTRDGSRNHIEELRAKEAHDFSRREYHKVVHSTNHYVCF